MYIQTYMPLSSRQITQIQNKKYDAYVDLNRKNLVTHDKLKIKLQPHHHEPLASNAIKNRKFLENLKNGKTKSLKIKNKVSKQPIKITNEEKEMSFINKLDHENQQNSQRLRNGSGCRVLIRGRMTADKQHAFSDKNDCIVGKKMYQTNFKWGERDKKFQRPHSFSIGRHLAKTPRGRTSICTDQFLVFLQKSMSPMKYKLRHSFQHSPEKAIQGEIKPWAIESYEDEAQNIF